MWLVFILQGVEATADGPWSMVTSYGGANLTLGQAPALPVNPVGCMVQDGASSGS